MSLEALAAEATAFARSSAYQYGDRTSFAVSLTDKITLPGKCSAAKYLDDLGIDKVPERVMVICPGNGGLIAECFARGAKFVLICEPRPRFERGLQGVLRLLSTAWRLEGKHDLTHQRIDGWPETGREQGFADMDLILWSEGVEEITYPKKIFRGVADCLTPGAKLVVEILHGTNGWVEEINSWRPNGHAVIEMADEIFGSPTETTAGRLSTARVYTLTLPGKKPKKKKKKKPKPAPKKLKFEKPKKLKLFKKLGPDKPLPLDEPKAEEPRHVHIDLAVDESRTGIKSTTGETLVFDEPVDMKMNEAVEGAYPSFTETPKVAKKAKKQRKKRKKRKKKKKATKTGL